MSAEEDAPHAVVPPPPFLSAPAPAAVLAALPGARAVGGCVRDALAERPVHDVDVAAPLPPDAVVPLLRSAGLKVFETGLAHGTVTAVLAGQPVEVTSLRRDVVTDGRHAEVEWTADWREDAARRDFTVNAMSLAADGRLWDYFGGREDLAAGRVRFVGDPDTRLREDYLRALRFFRFQARYGRGEPDPAALAAIRAAVPGLARLSAERVWMEIKRLLEAPDPSGAVALMAEAGVLGAVLPEGAHPALLSRLVKLGAPADSLLRLMAMLTPDQLLSLPDIPTADEPERKAREEARGEAMWAHVSRCVAVVRRLKASSAEASHAQDLVTPELLDLPRWIGTGAHRRDLSRFVRVALGRERIAGAKEGTVLMRTWLRQLEDDGPEWECIRDAIRSTPTPIFPLQGRDALASGVKPGPTMGWLLKQTQSWWLQGGCIADRAACLAKLHELAAARGI
jgi:poly(A) polymerase/tRNA nucleotidyltransferase (CCA-adding enzyme)